ncbi:MAG: TonB-dependent receptor [Cytophagales bacterium]|nr:MAG: TonB-dependent receptor [Cytophagales bacterium]
MKKSIKLYFYNLLLFSFLVDAQIKTDTISINSDTLELKQLVEMKSTAEFSEMEKDINQSVNVASKKALSYRKSPSVITVITEEEIRKSGARDIIDVLRQVPGFDFGPDVQGAIGLSIRGNWAHEGKHLLLLDGQEMNEALYGTVNYANTIPISQIKKIEIIRGAGSAIYGGFAEYAVINIITKTGADTKGVEANLTTGATSNGLSRLNTSVLVGNKIKDFEYSLSGMVGSGNRSDLIYTDLDGNTARVNKGASQLNPTFLNFSGAYKGFSARFMYDNLDTKIHSDFGNLLPKPYNTSFRNYFAELKHFFQISEKFNLTTKFNYKWQRPYHNPVSEADSIYSPLDAYVERYRGNITGSYDLSKKINIVAGGDFFLDYGKNNASNFTSLNSNRANFNNYSGFVQITYKNKIISPTLGFRVDKNTSFSKLAYSPRIGLVSRIWKLNLKLLYNQSFRAPTIFNIALNNNFNNKNSPNMTPETTQMFEFEIGSAISRNSYFTFNLFDITTNNPILYGVDSLGIEFYKNGDTNGSNSLGTRGFEMEYKIKDKWGFLNINYSFYTTAGKATVQDYAISGYNMDVGNINTGIAQQRVNLISAINITNKISISPSLSFWGNRYAATSRNENGEFITKFNPILLGNIFVNFNDVFDTKGLQFGFGCYDILNQKYHFLQTYKSEIAPVPSLSREFIVKMTYNLNN